MQNHIPYLGGDNQNRGTQLLEIYALEIQMHTAQKNAKKLNQLYEASLRIKSAIPHPLIMGLLIFFYLRSTLLRIDREEITSSL